MPPDENPQSQDIRDRDSDMDRDTERVLEDREKKENIQTQARIAASFYEQIGMTDQIKQSAEQRILVTPQEKILARQIENRYTLLKGLESNDDFSPDFMQQTLKRFADLQQNFHELVRSKETEHDRREKPYVAKKALDAYAPFESDRSKAGKEARDVAHRLRFLSEDAESTQLQVEVIATRLTELCGKLNNTAYAMQDDEEERDRATKDLDKYINEPEVLEDANPTRCVVRVSRGGDIIDVKIPEKYKDHSRKLEGSVALDKQPYYVEISVKGVERIEYILDRTIDQLRAIQNDEGQIDAFWWKFKEIHEKTIKKLIGSSSYEILVNAAGTPPKSKWFNLPLEDDIRRSTNADIDNHIKMIEGWKKNLQEGIKSRAPNDMLYINGDGKIED
jgi:hypothetical protein